MPPLIIIGASGHGKVICDAAVASGGMVLGFLDRTPPAREWCGRPVLGSDRDLGAVLSEHGTAHVVVAIGDNATRQLVAERAADATGCLFATVVHPRAVVADGVVLGPGTVVMAGAVLNPGAVTGAHCIVNTGATVDHDCTLGDFATVSPGVSLGGGVSVGRGSVVGIGGTVLHGRTIGDHAVVGAGAVVTEDLPDHVVAYGVPAQVIRSRREADRYL